MIVTIQSDYQGLIDVSPFQFKTQYLSRSEAPAAEAAVIIADADFLRQLPKLTQFRHRILISSETQLTIDTLQKIQPSFVVSTSQPELLSLQLKKLEEKVTKSEKGQLISKEIQRKRKELEVLNEKLISESEEQFSSLEKSNQEEMQKNFNEKSLLYFLDFISSESLNDDFVSQILKLIWKEIKRMGYAYQVGFCFQNLNQTVSLIAYNGIHERSETFKMELHEGFDPGLLASALGRPVGRLLSWKLSEFSRKGYFFVESIDQQLFSEQIQNYFKERLFTLSLYFDRWLIEKEYHLLLERWDQTFQSFSGSTHIIDESFLIHKSNYLKKGDSNRLCYQALAGRDSPCENCPLIKGGTTEFYLSPEKKVRASASEFTHLDKKYYFIFYEDMTDLDLLKSKVIQSEKMATVGRLGNHLSHELNNPLTGLKLYSQLLLQIEKEDALSASQRSDLVEILKATDRCEKIIKNLLQFSQQTEIHLAPISFKDVLESTTVLLKTALRSHRLFVDLKNDTIMADFTGLQQVLFNLIKNACQAMENPGSIKIFQIDERDRTVFCIQDSGPGLQNNVQKNLFSPFMTTKKVGEGTGLGLYLSKKIMQRMNADIEVNLQYKHGLQMDLVFKKI